MSEEKTLTRKQEAFVAAYLTSFNATAAARKAGYAKASESGYELLRQPQIKARINAHLDQIRQEGIGNRANRLAQLNSLHDDLLTVQQTRAEEAKERMTFESDVPAGAATGLMVERTKQIGTGHNATVEKVWEIDSTLVKERQSILEQAAREVGDRDKRLIELTGKDGGPLEVTSAKDKLLALIGPDHEPES